MSATSFVQARQTKYAAYAATYILVIIGVLTTVNVLANRYNKSYDTTSNKRYSLSDQTAKIVKGLKQDATITYFQQTPHFREGRDQLDLYENLSPKVHVKYVDPDKDPRLAREYGFRNYGDTFVQVGTNRNQAKGLTEEGITGAFIRDLKNSVRTVCFVAGSGEHDIDNSDQHGYSRFKDLLSKEEYVSKSVSLLQKAEIPAECTVTVVGGPRGDYLQPQVDAIKKYIEGGGRALFLLDPPLKMGRTEIPDNDALTAILSGWGVTPDKDLILDTNPIGQVVGVGPEVALITAYDSHPIVDDLKGTATGFPLSRSLDIKNSDKTTVTKLFSSSATSLATENLKAANVDPDDPKNKKGPLALAAAGTYNTGKENSQGRFVVIGSSDWLVNGFIGFNGNRDLALNSMNWLSSDEDLISIRPKEQDDRRITMTSAQMRWVGITSEFIFPLAVVFAGVTVWWRRR